MHDNLNKTNNHSGSVLNVKGCSQGSWGGPGPCEEMMAARCPSAEPCGSDEHLHRHGYATASPAENTPHLTP